MLIELITSPRGDWEILKRDGCVFASGHSIRNYDWLALLHSLDGITVHETEISDEEMERLC